MSQPTRRAEPQAFPEEIRELVRRLRSALADVLGSLEGLRGGRASELARRLAVDTKLAWKVKKLLALPDLFEAAQYAPGKAGMELFLTAAEEQGAESTRVVAARAAFARFQEAVTVHGGDRRTFNMLLAGQAEADLERLALDHRRDAFTANSYLWGLQARAQIKTYILHPSADGTSVDVVILAGFVELKSLRPDTTWPVSRSYRLDDSGGVHPLASEPIDVDAAAEWGELPVLSRFTTVPPRAWRPVAGRRAVVGFQRVQARVGLTGAVDFFTGELVRGAISARRTETVRTCTVHTRLRTPCESVVLDVFVHQDLFDRSAPEPRLYRGLFQGEVLSPLEDEDRMALSDKVEPLGTGLGAVRSPVLDAYPEILALACKRTGWDERAFDGWRVAMRFPPLPAILALHRDLPH